MFAWMCEGIQGGVEGLSSGWRDVCKIREEPVTVMRKEWEHGMNSVIVPNMPNQYRLYSESGRGSPQ